MKLAPPSRSPYLGPETAWWAMPPSELFDGLQASEQGLSRHSAMERLGVCGPNIMESGHRRSLLVQFMLRFRNPLVLLLLAASVISVFTADATSFAILIGMVVLSVSLDFFQEYRAEKTAETLRRSVAVKASVLRDGVLVDQHAEHLVPGDVVLLRAGDLVPADGRIIEANDFFVDQALLTGEPYPVEKRVGESAEALVNFADAGNAVFTGTTVISGSARMLICITGVQTFLGRTAGALKHAPPPTAFEKSTYQFGMLIVRLTFSWWCSCCWSTCCTTDRAWSPSCSHWRWPSA